MPTNYIYRIIESSDGHIWIATEKGVCKYDGLEIECFNSNNKLPDNDYFIIVEDYKDRIWFIGISDVLSYYYEDSIYNISTSVKDEFINLMHLNDSLTYFKASDTILRIDSNNDLSKFSILEDQHNEDYFEWARNSTCGNFMPKIAYDMVTKNIVVKLQYNQNDIQICRKNPSSGEYEKFSVPRLTKNYQTVLQFIKSMNSIQVFEGRHLMLFNSYFEPLDTFSIELEDNFHVNSSFLDSHGNIWISTKKGLFIQYEEHRKLDIKYIETTNGQNITNILNFNGGYIYGNDLEEIYQFQNNKFKSLFKEKNSFRNDFYSIIEHNEDVYFSNGQHGIRKFNSKTNVLSSVGDEYSFYTDRVKNSIKEFEITDEYIYGIYRYLFKFNRENKFLSTIEKDRLSRLLHTVINPDKDYIWVSDKDSLYQIKRQEPFSDEIYQTYSIRNIEHLATYKRDLIFGSTYSGYNFITNGSDLYIDDFILDERVNSTKTYGDSLFLNSDVGLYKLYLNDRNQIELDMVLDYRILGTNHIVNDFILFIDKYLLATNNGIVSIQRIHEDLNTDQGKLVFQIDRINNRKVDKQQEYNVRLPYKDRTLKMRYHSVIFKRTKTFSYEYFFDYLGDHKNSTNERQLTFNSLSPGKHKMRIRALDGTGNTSDWVNINVSVSYPWWRSWPFISILSIISFLIIYVLYRWNEKRVNNQLSFTRKMAELEFNALQSQMNPHFVFNALNSIQNLVISGKIEQADLYLSKFSKLLRLFLEGSRNKFIPLEEELLIIENYLEIEKLRFGEKLNYKIDNHLNKIDRKILVPATIVQPFVENALVHGLFHKKESGHLSIDIRYKNETVIITIEDNGIGREAARGLSNKKIHRSRGMEIIDDKFEILRKTEDFDASYKIEDIKEENLTGTRVILKLKNR